MGFWTQDWSGWVQTSVAIHLYIFKAYPWIALPFRANFEEMTFDLLDWTVTLVRHELGLPGTLATHPQLLTFFEGVGATSGISQTGHVDGG